MRPLLWLAAGVVVFVLLSLAIAPELLALPGRTAELLGIVAIAGLPGLLLLAVLVPRRRRVDAAHDAPNVTTSEVDGQPIDRRRDAGEDH